ncbi:GtrA family protein [Ferrimonas aestuarii]|uniref:GtrA family protein n=1 Tax=Ferrimonas aestuarii TaxID=2569539 RepID=A0A4U1BL98_9GAMM|nr:GtrA family protein [Ferrimonas aestuarii]TKB52035.1 GtrA family protein [Ferrimonas aestuarii]
MPTWIKFAIVGVSGFAVDITLFTALTAGLTLDYFVARALAFVAAASTTWIGNRLFTFAERQHGRASNQWRKALSAALMSALPNFAVFSLAMMWFELVYLGPQLSLVLGIGAGTVSNFALSHFWVFKDRAEERAQWT